MEHRMAIDRIREHLTTLHASPDIYEDGTCNLIYALEEFAIPALEKEIPKAVVTKREFGTSWGREYYACPNCDEYIRYVWALDPPTYPDRCVFCGQSLDWEREL